MFDPSFFFRWVGNNIDRRDRRGDLEVQFLPIGRSSTGRTEGRPGSPGATIGDRGPNHSPTSEFDPGSEGTLALCLTHASRTLFSVRSPVY